MKAKHVHAVWNKTTRWTSQQKISAEIKHNKNKIQLTSTVEKSKFQARQKKKLKFHLFFLLSAFRHLINEMAWKRTEQSMNTNWIY